MSHKRKVTPEGRVNIPQEYLERYDIEINDMVEVTPTRTGIHIKKFRDPHVCAITGKMTSRPIKIGESYFSKEGLKKMKEAMNELDV